MFRVIEFLLHLYRVFGLWWYIIQDKRPPVQETSTLFVPPTVSSHLASRRISPIIWGRPFGSGVLRERRFSLSRRLSGRFFRVSTAAFSELAFWRAGIVSPPGSMRHICFGCLCSWCWRLRLFGSGKLDWRLYVFRHYL